MTFRLPHSSSRGQEYIHMGSHQLTEASKRCCHLKIAQIENSTNWKLQVLCLPLNNPHLKTVLAPLPGSDVDNVLPRCYLVPAHHPMIPFLSVTHIDNTSRCPCPVYSRRLTGPLATVASYTETFLPRSTFTPPPFQGSSRSLWSQHASSSVNWLLRRYF